MFYHILGNSRLSLEADPHVIKRKNKYYLYSHDLWGIKEHESINGINFRFLKYVVKGGYRPFVDKSKLYYEKFTHIWKFPFSNSELWCKNLKSGLDSLIYNQYQNHSCPSIINGQLFFSTGLRKMDYGWTEPLKMMLRSNQQIRGLENITSLRKFKDRYFGTLIETKAGKSTARLVECLPIKFPLLWKIGKNILTPHMVSDNASHVYIASIIDDKLYFNVRFGWSRFAPEKILMTPFTFLT